MDRSTRRMDEGQSQPTPAPTDFLNLNKEFTFPVMPHTIPVGGIPGGIRPNYFPMGESQRHPSSPFPPQTGKRTLEPGPSYER